MTTLTKQTTTFKKVIITAKGGPEVIDYVEAAMIEPAAGEVRVKVEASDVAFADIMARTGTYPNIPPHPFIPGYDLVGVVDKAGAGVTDFAVGQRVGAFMLHFGGCAEYANVPAEMLIPVPENVDAGEAVSLFLNYLTAWQMLHDMAKVKPGDRVLITSAAGGVGTALLQLGKLAGLTMYGTASKGKLALVEELGGIPIDYRNEDFAGRILQDGGKLDAVFEAVAGETLSRAYRLVKKGGVLISFGFLSVSGSSMNAFLSAMIRMGWHKMMPDGKKLIFNSGIAQFIEKDNPWYRDTMPKLFQLLAEGKIKPIIGKRLPLSQTAQAQQLLEDGAVQGKIVLLAN
jgi:NADPH:quinone reductase-like Zn-dependent oxidoreductase